MTTNHIDQLTEWWENAEKGSISKGDTVIIKVDGGYVVETSDFSDRDPADEVRILARAPKPKPAWHDAVAVLASTSDFGIRRVFVKDVDGIWNDALSGRGSFEGNLRAVTPLIEAKVTDEMRKRVGDVLMPRYGTTGPDGTIDAILTAAFELETE